MPERHHLHLTEAERKLVCGIMVMDNEYIDRIKAAPPDEPIEFTADDLEDFAGYVAFEINHGKGPHKRRLALDAVCEKIEQAQHGDEPVPEPLKLPINEQDYVMAKLGAFLDELEATSGIDLDKLLGQMQPNKIGPDEKLDLNLTPAEREMLVGLLTLPDALRDEIRQAPASRRKFQFTLAQIDQMQAGVSAAAKDISDQKTHRQWQRLERKFTGLQKKYTTGDEQNALGRALAGEKVPQAAAVRDLMAKLLEARKKRG